MKKSQHLFCFTGKGEDSFFDAMDQVDAMTANGLIEPWACRLWKIAGQSGGSLFLEEALAGDGRKPARGRMSAPRAIRRLAREGQIAAVMQYRGKPVCLAMEAAGGLARKFGTKPGDVRALAAAMRGCEAKAYLKAYCAGGASLAVQGGGRPIADTVYPVYREPGEGRSFILCEQGLAMDEVVRAGPGGERFGIRTEYAPSGRLVGRHAMRWAGGRAQPLMEIASRPSARKWDELQAEASRAEPMEHGA